MKPLAPLEAPATRSEGLREWRPLSRRARKQSQLLLLVALVSATLAGGGCSSSTPRVEEAPRDASVDTEGDGGPGARSLCRAIYDDVPLEGTAYFASAGGDPKATGGAWVFAYAFPSDLAPYPGSAVSTLIKDGKGALVGKTTDAATLLKDGIDSPLLSKIVIACNGSPPCKSGENSAQFIHSEGTTIVHALGTSEGSRFALELWAPVLRRNTDASGIKVSEAPTDCLSAGRLAFVGPVKNVTALCPGSGKDLTSLACSIAKGL